MPVETMAGHIGKLTLKEQQIICGLIQKQREDPTIHPGKLPFIPFDEVRHIMSRQAINRPLAVIISKLGVKRRQVTDLEHSTLSLNKGRVKKYFGSDYKKRYNFNWLPMKYIGGAPISRSASITLTGHSSNGDSPFAAFILHVHPEYEVPIAYYLIDNC